MKCACAVVGLLAFAAVAAAQEAKDTGQKTGDAAQKASADAPKAGQGAEAAPRPKSETAQGAQTAEQLATKLRAAGVMCTEFGPGTYGLLDDKYQQQMPQVATVRSCTTDDDGDITFEVFEDAAHARQFIDVKRTYLCKRAKDYGLEQFPGFPYVDGGVWIIEPDDKETADKVATILGGKANMGACDEQK